MTHNVYGLGRPRIVLARWVHRAALAAAVLAVAWAGLTVGAEQAAAAPLRTMITLNICGGECNAGSTGRIVDETVALIRQTRPDVVSLQEVCHSQQRAIRAELDKLGYRSTHTTTRRSNRCNDRAWGNRFGNSLFVKGGWTSRWRVMLPYGRNPSSVRGVEPRALLCVRAKFDGRPLVCATHISPRDPDNRAQLVKVRDVLAPWSARTEVVAAGDWNQTASGVRGVITFFRVCPNTPARIDHVFTDGAPSTCQVRDIPSTDHNAVIVTRR